MQTEMWLTGTAHADQCPLCNTLLQKGSNVCPTCGFTTPTSTGRLVDPADTPTSHIPLRASRRQPDQTPKKQSHPLTPIPPRASSQQEHSTAESHHVKREQLGQYSPALYNGYTTSSGWRHESSGYKAASSLPSLSLIISETPTAPPRSSVKATRRLPRIDEIATLPPGSSRSSHVNAPMPAQSGAPSPSARGKRKADLALVTSRAAPPSAHSINPGTSIDEFDTIPSGAEDSAPAVLPLAARRRKMEPDDSSWTSGNSARSSYPALLVARSPRALRARGKQNNPSGFNALDRVRWWLLHPGRLELLLWIAGTILLIGVTCAFSLFAAFSFNWMGAGSQHASSSPANTPVNSQGATTPGAHLVLLTKVPVPQGHALAVSGHGFSPRSHIVFLLDSRQALLNQHGTPGSTEADPQGNFTVTLWLGSGSSWSAGHHLLVAQETKTRRQAAAPLTITPGPVNRGGESASATVVAGNPNPTTPFPGSSNSGGSSDPIPASPTPMPPTPTPGKTPTPVPTPSPTTAPTSTATPGSTPTMTRNGTPSAIATPSPTIGNSTGSTNLGNSLNASGETRAGNHLASLNPLVWLVVACYCLSMVLLGLAGVLHKRRLR